MRQGDPLSLLLFCLAEDVPSRGISHLVNSGFLKTISGPKNSTAPSHVLYADDVLVFCKGSKRNLQALMRLFEVYSRASGQHLSLNKCKFYTGSASPSKIANLSAILGFSAGSLPFNYLGVPIFKGKPTKSQLQPIANKILSKLASWKGSLLPIMGKVELIKSVIQRMLLYSFQVYARPVSLLKHLDKSIRNYIWAGPISTRNIVTLAWKIVCLPLVEGGLGIKSLRTLNKAALLKLSWEFLASDKEWVSFLKARFFQVHKPSIKYVESSIWPGIKLNMQIVLSDSIWMIGDGKEINFLLDNWISQPLVEILNIPASLHKSLTASVVDVIENGKWIIPEELLAKLSLVGVNLHQITVPSCTNKDQLVWKESNSGILTLKDAFNHFNPPKPQFDWGKIIWNSLIPPLKSFVAWRLLYNKHLCCLVVAI